MRKPSFKTASVAAIAGLLLVAAAGAAIHPEPRRLTKGSRAWLYLKRHKTWHSD